MLSRSVAMLFLLATAASANPNCPSNLVVAGSVTKNSTNPSEHADSFSQCQFGEGSSSAGYDIPRGVLSVSARVIAECGAVARVTVQDDFRVVGVPAGTPVAVVAVLHVSCTSSGATMTDALGNRVGFSASYEGGQGEVTLPIAALAEQPFRLTFDSQAFGDYAISGSAGASFHFTGLPPGTAVVSCNGYVSDQSVAARPTTWGKLKRMYR